MKWEKILKEDVVTLDTLKNIEKTLKDLFAIDDELTNLLDDVESTRPLTRISMHISGIEEQFEDFMVELNLVREKLKSGKTLMVNED